MVENMKLILDDCMNIMPQYPNDTQTEIAKTLGMHIAEVNRMLKNNYKPYKTKARYFSDFERDYEWFQNLKAKEYKVKEHHVILTSGED